MKKIMSCLFMIGAALISITGQAQKLQVATEDWRPYNYQEGAEVKGASTEIVKQVLAHAGIKYSIDVFPWARAYALAQAEPNVMIYTIIRIPEREKLFKWVRPLGNGGTTSLYRLKTNQKVNPKTLEEAKKFTIITNNESMDHTWLKSNGFPHIQAPPMVKNSIQMFFSGARGELIAFDDSVITSEFKQFGFDTSQVVKVMPLFKTPPYFAVSLGTSDKLLDRLQKSYDALLAAKKIQLVN